MGQQFGALATLWGTGVWFPGPIWQLTTICNSGSWGPAACFAYKWCIYICRETPKQKRQNEKEMSVWCSMLVCVCVCVYVNSLLLKNHNTYTSVIVVFHIHMEIEMLVLMSILTRPRIILLNECEAWLSVHHASSTSWTPYFLLYPLLPHLRKCCVGASASQVWGLPGNSCWLSPHTGLLPGTGGKNVAATCLSKWVCRYTYQAHAYVWT